MDNLINEHRGLLTQSIDPTVIMRLRKQAPGIAQFIGLWGIWQIQPDGVPSAIRVLLATVRTAAPLNPEAEAIINGVPLADLPWNVLQLQTTSNAPTGGDPVLWAEASVILADDLRMEGEADMTGSGCAGSHHIVYNPQQRSHKLRSFADTEVLSGYKVRRIDNADEVAGLARPVNCMERERVAYRVFNIIEDRAIHAPILVYMEKRVPRKHMLWQRMQNDNGFTKEGDLLGALSEGKTWIVIDEAREICLPDDP
jgi:hypothetical protein